MKGIILGPVLCRGCGTPIYWGRYGLRSHIAGTVCWRNAIGRHGRHYCEGGLR